MTNQQWRLAARPAGPLTDSLFTFHEEDVAEVKDGQVLIETLYLSLDPTQRVWIERDSYLPAVRIGDVMRGGALGRVLQSANPKIPVGATVQAMTGWQRYAVMDGAAATVLPKLKTRKPPAPPTMKRGLPASTTTPQRMHEPPE